MPWSSFWEQNYFAERWPALLAFVRNNFVRGAVSGLGVVNLFAGLADLSTVFAPGAPTDATTSSRTGGDR